MRLYKRVMGLVLLSFGAGMLLVLFIPGWGFILAAIIVFIGFSLMTKR